MIQKKLHEYEELGYDQIEINREQALALESYLNRAGLGSVFEFHSNYLKASQYVGVVNFRGRRIDVLPKLLSGGIGDDNAEEIRLMQRNLLTMLSYTHHLNIKDSDISHFDLGKDNLLDVYIFLFARDLYLALEKESLSAYEKIESNESFIKGKINFTRDTLVNQFNRSKTICNFNTFQRDNIYNQIFLFVCERFQYLTRNVLAKRYLIQSLKLLEGVTKKNLTYHEVKDREVSRSFEHFKKPFSFAKLFLKNSSPTISEGSFENYCLMFNMNEVFEEFIFAAIKRNMSFLGVSKIQFQRKRELFQSWTDLNTNSEFGSFGRVINDIYIEFASDKRPPLIIDTKYKIISSVKDISTADFFQMLTYRHIESENGYLDVPEIKLVFPEKGPRVKARLTFSGKDKTLINVRSICLRDLSSETIMNKLKDILEP